MLLGFNKYYPPDYDGEKHGSLNSYRGDLLCICERLSLTLLTGKHALGDRARKLDQGILITRFELPFNIWWYVAWSCEQPWHLMDPAEHATTILAWVCVTTRKRRKSGHTIQHLYSHSDANATCVMAGLRSRQTRKYALQLIYVSQDIDGRIRTPDT